MERCGRQHEADACGIWRENVGQKSGIFFFGGGLFARADDDGPRGGAEQSACVLTYAGEARGAESVLSALRQGAKRIGHGVRAAYDEKAVSEMLAAGVTAELCYTSNLQTGAWSAAKEYPLRYFMERGVKVTLNTDNTAVSKTSLKREYELLRVTPEEERILDANARAAAFENRLLE